LPFHVYTIFYPALRRGSRCTMTSSLSN